MSKIRHKISADIYGYFNSVHNTIITCRSAGKDHVDWLTSFCAKRCMISSRPAYPSAMRTSSGRWWQYFSTNFCTSHWSDVGDQTTSSCTAAAIILPTRRTVRRDDRSTWIYRRVLRTCKIRSSADAVLRYEACFSSPTHRTQQGVAVSCLFFTLDQSAFGILITWLPCLHTKHLSLPGRFW